MATRPIIFGEVPNIPEGHWFEGRKEMMPTSFQYKDCKQLEEVL